MGSESPKFQSDHSDSASQQHASFVSALGELVRTPTHLVSLVVAFITGMGVVGAAVIGRHGGGSSPTRTTESVPATAAAPVSEPARLRVGGLYYMFAPSDKVLWQVVDVSSDPRL